MESNPLLMLMQPHYPPQQYRHPDVAMLGDISIVPARVEKALEFVAMTMHKTADRGIPGDSTAQVVEGKPMTDDEANCAATACSLLSKYFAGQLPADEWEKVRRKAAHKRLEKGTSKERDVDSRLIICPICGGAGQSVNCKLCNGAGRVMITPVLEHE